MAEVTGAVTRFDEREVHGAFQRGSAPTVNSLAASPLRSLMLWRDSFSGELNHFN